MQFRPLYYEEESRMSNKSLVINNAKIQALPFKKAMACHPINACFKPDNTPDQHLEKSINLKQKFIALSALLFAIGMAMLTMQQAIAQVTGPGVKWHPGHYYELVGQIGKGNPLYLDDVYKEIQQTPALSVIGTRFPSQHAKDKMQLILPSLINENWIIVSGMAKGIDS